MKKVLAYICVVIGLYLCVASYDRSMMEVLAPGADQPTGSKWWPKSTTPWGDLTKMAMLDDVKQFQEHKDYKFSMPSDNGLKNIELYLYGDSYIEDVPGLAFANIRSFHFGRKNVGLFYELDSTKHNILIIETAERFVRGSYDDDGIYQVIKRKEKEKQAPKRGSDEKKLRSAIVNNNLEHLLFEFNNLSPIRRVKAEMNYSLFHRASGDVVISDDSKYLFFRPIMAPTGAYSYTYPITDNIISYYVHNLNNIYDHYRKEGFDEVYFSIIPNPSTILQPSGYNGLIPKLNNSTALRLPLLDIYNIFKNSHQPDTFYRKGDTHWNNKGLQTWLRVVNDELKRKSKELAEKDRKYDIAQ